MGLGSMQGLSLTCARLGFARDRTGVQLKDKWRNLVKFKHVSRVEADVAAAKSASFQARCDGGFWQTPPCACRLSCHACSPLDQMVALNTIMPTVTQEGRRRSRREVRSSMQYLALVHGSMQWQVHLWTLAASDRHTSS